MTRVYPLPDSGEGRPAELVDLCLEQFVLSGFKRPEGPDASAFADAIERYLFGESLDTADERLLTDPADGQCPRCRCVYPDTPGGRCKAPGHGMEFRGEVGDGDWLVRHYFCDCGWGPFRFATRAVPEQEQAFARLVGGGSA